MTQPLATVNLTGKAPLYNVSSCLAALRELCSLPVELQFPRMGTFYGPSGFGKSTAAAVAQRNTNAYYVQAQSTWTRKAVFLAILKVMGIKPAKTTYDLNNQVCDQLARSQRPLIIDETDYLVDKGIIEVVRDIYEGSYAPILLIGEEQLPTKLKQYERFHGRISSHTAAEPVSVDDVSKLCSIYANKITIADDLLVKVHTLANGSVRRVCVNLFRIQSFALGNGLKEVDLAAWGDKELYTGDIPMRRIAV